MSTHEREITEPVALTRPDGRLDPAAVGWSRRPLHDTALPGRWGRRKKWEYWCFTTPTHLVAVTVSHLDYMAVNGVYFLEYGGTELEVSTMAPFGPGVRLPDSLDGSDITVASGKVRVSVLREAGGTRVRATCPTSEGPLTADLFAALPEGHESMNVVIPWDDRRYQFTSKQVARPAEGTLTLGGRSFAFDGGWAVLDHGRGRWPYDTLWNWGAASGTSAGRTIGLQFGGKWTDGTGMTENAVLVDGRLTKIGADLAWEYDPADFRAPWRIHAPGAVDLVFTPFHERHVKTDALLLANHTHQLFGHYAGTIHPDEGPALEVDGLLGWAEQVRMRW
ncbi:uncharacterized protein DUF2804 [Actinocorallia herbida]|uniref:Uncharacterized protein DUF2804 n=1 Tax=Actinocorallia herbida TaxID=58109 RepID=A0A3N1D488_9ACTN|nr:DUF2804 domain-containing protein [Actinocorallia herbida]ROO88335.1 uncharacterized protein DUF2804 [Actinocorallia herbida]